MRNPRFHSVALAQPEASSLCEVHLRNWKMLDDGGGGTISGSQEERGREEA